MSRRLRVVVEIAPRSPDRCSGCRFLTTTEPRSYKPGSMRVKPWCTLLGRRLAETTPKGGGEGNYTPARVIRHDLCRDAQAQAAA